MTPATAVAPPGLLERDRGLVWHPYAALDGPAPYAVDEASGTRLVLEAADGARFEAIDAMSSWWCAIHGYRNPVLDAALREQAGRFSHVMFGGLTHEPAVRLAEQLTELAPEPLRHVFFADSGSVSVEVALKLAVQYQAAVGHPGRRRFAALRGAYHGDTTGAMSVCDPVDGMHALFTGLVTGQVFLPRPPAARLAGGRFAETAEDDAASDAWLAEAERVIAEHQATIAGIVVEPVLQGAGGMHVYPPRCLAGLRRIADRHGLLLIADEIATGFGRTGAGFGVDWAGVIPDVMCVGKALTGGYLTLAAVLCAGQVAEAVTRSPQRALMHGPTFMANPLACAVASASLELLTCERRRRVSEIGEELAVALRPAADLASVRDVRVLGAVGVVQLTSPVDVAAVTRTALEHGVWVRPFRDLVYTMPPYIATSGEVAAIGAAITRAVAGRRMAERTTVHEWLAQAADQRGRSGTVRATDPRRHPRANGNLLDLASNDYLGLADDPRLRAAAAAATGTFGTGAGASRVVTGTTDAHAEAEHELAVLTGQPSCLVFSSGYTANIGILTALGDPGTLLVSDAHVHASLVDGARLSRSPVEICPHRDLYALDRLLRTRAQPRAIVVIESIYSVLGDAADIARTAAICATHGALLIVDEAHGIGVAGSGRGAVHAAGLAGAGHVVITATLSKALGAQGGAVLGPAILREHLVSAARTFLFDTALAPAAAAAAAAACRVIAAEPHRVAALHEVAGRIAAAAGIDRAPGAVQSVPIGSPDVALATAQRLYERGVLVGCFRPPTVPDGISRLRLTARATADAGRAAEAAALVRRHASPAPAAPLATVRGDAT